MKTALVLALSLTYTIPAFSQSPNKAALAEARRFLIPCSTYSGNLRGFCEVNHMNFLHNYILAKSGDPDLMANIAFVLDEDINPSCPQCTGVGIRQNKRQACAWIVTSAESTADTLRLDVEKHRYASNCSQVSPNEALAINERADVLLRELRDNPTTSPPEEAYVPSKGSGPMIITVPDTD